MFNQSKKKNGAMGTSKTGAKAPTVNIISKGSRLTGNLHSASDIRVAGSLEGEVLSENKVIVTASGKIDGNVEATEADVAGTIQGEVKVADKLVLRKTAVVEGDIHTKILLVEEGAEVNGKCSMKDQPPVTIPEGKYQTNGKTTGDTLPTPSVTQKEA